MALRQSVALAASVTLALALLSSIASGAEVIPTALDRGFASLYNLDFEATQQEFGAWQRQHPDDPLGYACEAGGILFAEFVRMGILETELFADDDKFVSRKTAKPDRDAKEHIDAALKKAEVLARPQLAADPKSAHALLALSMTTGIRGDYLALIERRYLAAFRHGRQSSEFSEKLVTCHPDWYDAYLAGGASQYVFGSLIAPLRWGLQLMGYQTDKQKGAERVRLTATRGRFFRPFAKLLLAVIELREKRPHQACEILETLRTDFPKNHIFARELSRLQQSTAAPSVPDSVVVQTSRK